MFKRMGILLLSTAPVIALPVLNPADPDMTPLSALINQWTDFFSVRLSFRGDYVYNRNLKDADHNIARYSLFANEGVLTLNFFDRVDVYGLVGAANQTFASMYSAPSLYLNNTFYTETVWGAGIKALLGKWRLGKQGTTFLSASFDYERIHTAGPFRTTVGLSPFTSGLKDEVLVDVLPNCSYQETQVALALGHRIKQFIPYIAIKGSSAHVKAQGANPVQLFENLESQYNMGYAVGLSFVDKGRMAVTAEARFVDEKAMTIMASCHF